MKNIITGLQKGLITVIVVVLLMVLFISPQSGNAQVVRTLNQPTGQSIPIDDPSKSSFRLVNCDGPDLKGITDPKALSVLLPENDEEFIKRYGHPKPYVACDFSGAIGQVQHLINIFIVVGILFTIIMFSYAGYLYITGEPKKIDEAKGIFKKVVIGFVIMLTAWFIVYQLLDWLAADSAVKYLLGKSFI